MTDITITLTKDEVQFLLNSLDTHIKTNGLVVATAGAVMLAKFTAASNDQMGANSQGANETDSEGDQEHESAG